MSDPVDFELLSSEGLATLPTGSSADLEEIGWVNITGGGGGGGGPDTLDVQVAQDTPAYSLVTANGLLADSANIAHYGKVIGMTPIFVANGQIAQLLDDDEVTNGAWAWSPGTKLFLNGTVISATPPSSGFSQMVAVARNANIIIVKLGPPILL